MVLMQFESDLILQRVAISITINTPCLVMKCFQRGREVPLSTVVTVNFYLGLSSFQISFLFLQNNSFGFWFSLKAKQNNTLPLPNLKFIQLKVCKEAGLNCLFSGIINSGGMICKGVMQSACSNVKRFLRAVKKESIDNIGIISIRRKCRIQQLPLKLKHRMGVWIKRQRAFFLAWLC